MIGDSGTGALVERLTAAIEALSRADAKDQAEAGQQCLDELRAPVRLAVGGEFSSGKSTLVKMMLGSHVVVPGAAASSVPTVRFYYADPPVMYLFKGEEAKEISQSAKLSRTELLECDRLDVGIRLSFLKELEIFDTPGTSDPNRSDDQITSFADEVDFIIWCTNATQAWRQSERQMFCELNEAARENSLLVVTHIDLPRVKASLDRLMGRLEKEAGPLFSDVVPVDLMGASAARDADRRITDRAAWASSGAERLTEAIEQSARAIREPRIRAAEEFLASCEGMAIATETVAEIEEPVAVSGAAADWDFADSEPLGYETGPDSTPACEAAMDAGPEPEIQPEIQPEPEREPEPEPEPLSFAELWSEGYGRLLVRLEHAEPEDESNIRAEINDLLNSFEFVQTPGLIAWGNNGAEIRARLAEAGEYLETIDPRALRTGFADHAQLALAQLDWEFDRLAAAG